MPREPSFWSRERPNLLASSLAPASLLFRALAAARRASAFPYREGIPVVCIGNIVAGGSGKTPLALHVARFFQQLNAQPALLLRGYRARRRRPLLVNPLLHSARDVGDEALELALADNPPPVFIARNKSLGARRAALNGAKSLVLDDGLQNPRLHHDFRILVSDPAVALGNQRVIPAGPLRETPKRAFQRLHTLLLLHSSHDPSTHPSCPLLLKTAADADVPVLHASLKTTLPDAAKSAALLPFHGVAGNDKFLRALQVVAPPDSLLPGFSFPDHHSYSKRDAQRILRAAQKHGGVPITTPKDHARLLKYPPNDPRNELAEVSLVARLNVIPHPQYPNDLNSLHTALRSLIIRAYPKSSPLKS